MKHSLLALTSLSLSLAVSALNLPLRQAKRASFVVSNAGSSAGQLIDVTDDQDLIYLVNITLAGQPYTLQLDSGSSDLWITTSGTVSGQQSNINLNLTYGVGYAYGPIATADVAFAGFDITSQAYVAATQVNNPATAFGAQGILGMGFTHLSSIDMAINETGSNWGRSLMYNIFALNKAEPNFVTMLLERAGNQTQGTFTIGEYDSRYAGVANTAPIPTFPQTEPSRWTLVVDEIIVNGKTVPLSSAVPNAPSGKAVALLDSGTSLVYAPPDVVTALYGGMPNTQFSSSLNQWIVPCDTEIDVSIVINGRHMNLHPLDTVQPTSNGSQTCFGSWLPQSLSIGKAEFDLIFGDAVMRSFYTVYNFGDFTPNNRLSGPSLQLWSLVDGTMASFEFNQARGGTSNSRFLANDNVNAPANSSSSSSSNDISSSTDISDLQTKVHNIIKWAPIAIGVAALNVLVMLVVLIVSIAGCVRRRRNDRSMVTSGSFVPLPLGSISHSYRPVSLQETPKYNSGERERYSD